MSEKLSSLFDNEVQKEKLSEEIDKLSSRSSNKNTWTNYQVIRDILQNNFTNTPNLTDKIMQAIDKEPTQISGYIHNNESTLAENPYKHWKIAASFAAFFIIGISAMSFTTTQNSQTVQLVQEDVSEEIIARHYANTSLNAGYFIQANFSQQD
jgi:negative regulator of sigma E activity